MWRKALQAETWETVMRLSLNNEDDPIAIPIDDVIREAWTLQYDRAHYDGGMDRFRERLAVCFANSLAACLDTDLQPPTAAQMQYATSIARELGVSLPYEALRFRGTMSDFIDRYADALRAKRETYLRNEE
ncbi:hypothetical protein [Dyella sp. EPa41]|uniref:hypothetical protein n=1 Tax=Dyella sp. EPa41 TaxID=1561194 RepID=UPI0027DD8E05|nr:hypothetical protein [Dyella sp. EPa41]